MKDKKAAEILIKLLERPSFSQEEKKAIESAIGILSLMSLSEGRVKKMKEKKEKMVDWKNN